MKLSRYFHNDWHNKWFKCILEYEFKHNDWSKFWRLVSVSKNATTEIIRNNLDERWDWECVRCNHTSQFINECDYMTAIIKCWDDLEDSDFDYILENSIEEHHEMIFADEIKYNNETEFEMQPIVKSSNMNIPFECIEAKNINQRYFKRASCIKNYPIKTITDNPDLPWNWYGISRNENLTLSIIAKHYNLPWCWDSLIDVEFLVDKQHFIQTQTKNATILQMHLHFDKHTDQVITPIEYVLFDSYLAKCILQY